MQMKEAINQFCEWRELKVTHSCVLNYRFSLIGLCLYSRNPDIEAITLDDIMEYLHALQDMGYDTNSLIPKTIAIRKFFEFLRMQQYNVLHSELIPVPYRHRKLPRVANDDDFKQLLAAIPSTKNLKYVRDRALVRVLYDTGARAGEILSLQMDQIDLVGMSALIKTEKSKGARPFRRVFWTQATNRYFKEWIAFRSTVINPDAMHMEGDPVFISIRKGERVQKVKQIRVSSLSFIFREYSRQAGIDPINPHSLRHRLAHQIIQQGGSTADVANILGHSSMGSSLIYVMMDGKELEERYRKFRK